MERLRGAIRNYAWGSRTAIAEFTGRSAPAPHSEAELWLGAHPADPAMVECSDGDRPLIELISADPEAQLGPAVCARFGAALPFLVKVLAADEPLSLQAHPSSEQAIEGFAHEERAGVPLSSPVRNYRDRSHKPELIVALEPFEAMAGFRPVARTVELMRSLAVPELDPFIALLQDQCEADGLRVLFTTWITAPPPTLDVLVPAVLDGAIGYVRSGATEFAAVAKTLLELGERYPGDAGVLASMLLNRVRLEPGQAIYLPAGNLHAYLRGVGVEVMANSDNVLRGGLTPKHVDVPELLRILDFNPVDEDVLLPPVRQAGFECEYLTPAEEFAVSVFTFEGKNLGVEIEVVSHHEGPQILLCTRGSVVAAAKSGDVKLERGSAAWVSADDGPIRVIADEPATLFRSTVGDIADAG